MQLLLLKPRCTAKLLPLTATTALWRSPPAGVYKVWAVINGRMTAIPLRMPRTFYVDASAAPGSKEAAGLGPVVKRMLPGGVASAHTYQARGCLRRWLKGSEASSVI